LIHILNFSPSQQTFETRSVCASEYVNIEYCLKQEKWNFWSDQKRYQNQRI